MRGATLAVTRGASDMTATDRDEMDDLPEAADPITGAIWRTDRCRHGGDRDRRPGACAGDERGVNGCRAHPCGASQAGTQLGKDVAMNDTERAEKILTELRGKRAAAVAHGVALGEERTRLAFGAHALGDSKSRKRLDEINRESALHDSELRSLDAAISEAAARVERARQAEAQAQGRGVARELLKRAAHLVELAQTLDDANRIRGEVSCAIAEELTQMRQIAHGLGVFVPTEQQFLSLGERAERTTLMEMPFHRIAERLSPNEKRNHSSYAQPWRDQIVKGCAALLGDKQEEAA
jgi:hypothetical protein